MSGKRNEPAREQRRCRLRRAGYYTSLPESTVIHDGKDLVLKLSLLNHFGWKVLGKSEVGDGWFPNVSLHYENADKHGRDFKNVIHALHLNQEPDIEKYASSKHLKGTQTDILGIAATDRDICRNILDMSTSEVQKIPKVKAKREEEPKVHKVKREQAKEQIIEYQKNHPTRESRKLISEFYYLPKDYFDTHSQASTKKSHHIKSSSPTSRHGDGDVNTKKKNKKSKRKHKGPDRWQLRAKAGAEKDEDSDEREVGEICNKKFMPTFQTQVSVQSYTDISIRNKPTHVLETRSKPDLKET